jgi:hypothetical protein
LLWTSQRIADARNAIPLAFLSCGVVYQHAIHEPAGEVATVVPNHVVAEAGNHEEPWRDLLVNNVSGRIFLGQEDNR